MPIVIRQRTISIISTILHEKCQIPKRPIQFQTRTFFIETRQN